jgi:DNA invertase Pin-like site-specific DNA recombinase
MIAAIYARKSTEQNGVADEQKSITRQVEHARGYAVGKGWTVDEASVYVDDGISGAEFANRPGFLRLMNALKPWPSFQVLIMSEESRLGREAIETAYALKQLVQAGVRVFFYLEDPERTLDSPTDKIMLSLTTFADELEREKARQPTADAMTRKARAGHVHRRPGVRVRQRRRPRTGRSPVTWSGVSTRPRRRRCGRFSSSPRSIAARPRSRSC